jgi:hypothetical protein
MEWAPNSTLVSPNMLDNGKWEKKMETEKYSLLMVASTKDSFRLIKFMDLANTFGQMEKDI